MPSTLTEDVKQSATAAYGAVPNFLRNMTAHTAAPGAAYIAADQALTDGLLSPTEQQAVILAICTHHDSRYDAVAHARLALDAGLSPDVVERLLSGKLPQDTRLRALIEATRQTYDERGWLAPETIQNLEERGVSRGELYEIFALYGMKTFSSFVNHIAEPEIDPSLTSTEENIDNIPEKPSAKKRDQLVFD